MKRVRVSVLVALSTLTLAVGGEPKPGQQPKNLPVELKLKSLQDSYKLDLGGKTKADFLAELEAKTKRGDLPPQPPAVDLELEIRNVSANEVKVWVKGDPVQIELEIKGPGAKVIRPPLAFTQEFRLPQFATLGAGQSHKIAFKSLRWGHRGNSVWGYWLEPGEYTITARFKTGVQPLLPGIKPQHGASPVTLVSNAIKVEVK